MGLLKGCLAGLLALAALTSTSAAQVTAAPAETPAMTAASALVEGITPGVVDELSRQLPMVFRTTVAAELNDAQQAQLSERLVVMPELIRAAMEQRWVERAPPHLPPKLQEHMNEFLQRSRAGRRGELGAARPPTRDIVAEALANRFSEAQLQQIGAFLATPAGHAMSYQFATASVQRRAPDLEALSAEERAAIGEFARSPEGEAYLESAERLTQIVVEQLRLNTMTRGPELMLEFTGILCDVLGPSCESIE
jgi:hypothetical protein